MSTGVDSFPGACFYACYGEFLMVMGGLVPLAVFVYLGGCPLLVFWSHDLLKVLS